MKTIKYNSERYERIRVLGQGSFGTAIVHRRRPDCALVVLKEIDLLKFKDERERLNALQEARIMSELCHDNIIKYYNAYATETKLIIEMEYARLGTLQTYLSLQNQLLEESEILCIFRQILSGICYLHSKNIVHLDLKMANVFVSSEGTIKIGDFGIAQFMPKTNQDNANSNNNNNNNAQQQQLGTLAYSSPERCLGSVSNPIRSDIWSLGCILYELITLEPLFSSESLAEMVIKITRIDYKPIDRNIVASMKHLFERMISRDADDRPDADELILEVDQILEHIETRKQRANGHKNSRRRRHHQPRIANRHHKPVDVSTDAAFFAQDKRNLLTQINYPHSLIYQVRLNTNQIAVDRVNLPQSKRIKEISKGRSHYLVLTYDNIVYGWGSRNRGQLGACNLLTSLDLLVNNQQQPRDKSINKSLQLRSTRSATNSFTAADLITPRNLLVTGGQRASLTQPSSLASSTQTIIAATSTNITTSSSPLISKPQNAGETSLGQSRMDLLDEAEPVSKPFIINELNKRKIERIAAGNDFSVFLSKTGIVMACGDGSTGCLGRGDLKVSVSPCMVDSLLNMDVVDIACGPEHVVAICGDGQVFTWGNMNHGRLGISTDMLNRNNSYVALPQQVKFKLSTSQNQSQRSNVFITSAVCGDRCTIFIDSNYNCWACGENRHNKLGLDIKRRFKKTIVIKNAYKPTKITALGKYKIISCKIGKNHSSFLTLEGKMLVFGQDIDHSYRLRANRIFNRESHRRTSYELKTNSNRRKQQLYNQRANQAQVSRYGYNSQRARQKNVNYKYLANCLLTNNQLIGYKSSQFDQRAMVQVYPKLKTTSVQRHQLESYIKKTRCNKKMPFSSVIGMSCTSKFTLALTNDNRVYFWGTRSYERSELEHFPSNCPRILKEARRIESITRKMSPKGTEPQLVSNHNDECFVKIGPTNSTLMTNIQLMGSDQPILQARDPRLIANSLADLWILDYQPESSSSSECSSHSSCSSLSSICSDCCDSCCSSCPSESSLSSCRSNHNSRTDKYSKELIDHSNCKYCQKHDAILEPQPIVSLYVPSMFNHNGSTLKLVNLFCFDEDSFFLIIDTNISFQQQQQQQSVQKHQQISNNTTTRSQMKRSNAQTNTQHFNQPNITKNRSNSIVANHPAAYNSNLMQRRGLDLVEESNSNSSQEAKIRHSLQNNKSKHPVNLVDSLPDGMNIITKSTSLIEGDQKVHQELSSPPDCCRQVQGEADASLLALDCLDEFGSSPKSTTQDENGEQSQGLHQTPTSNGFSLEEPRSMSTFIAALGDHIVVAGPTLNCARTRGESMRKLSFGNGDDDDNNLPFGGRRKRRQRYQTNQSESTAATGDDLDETSVMPTWVRDEFIQQEQASRPINFNSCQDINNRILSSEESDSNELVASSLATLVTAHNKSCDNLAAGQQVVYNNGTSSITHNIVGGQTDVVYFNNNNNDIILNDRPRGSENLSSSLGKIGDVIDRTNVSLFTDDLRLLSKSQPDLRDDLTSLRRTSDGINGQSSEYIISQNIIDCSVYKSAKDQQPDNHSDNLQDLRDQSYSDLSSLLSRQDTIKSVCSTRSVMRDEVIATTISQDLSATKKRQTVAETLRSSVDRYSSSCADFRDSDKCTTIINQRENYRQRRESSGSISRHEQQQRGFGVGQRLAAFDSYDLSRYNRAALGRPESRTSLSSIRKSLMKIFC